MTKQTRTPHGLDDETLEAIVRQAADVLGDVPPDALPHLLRERLKGQLAAERDIDAVVEAVRRERTAHGKR